MAKGDPFLLNKIMSSNRFDYIIISVRFTNIEVPYEDVSFIMR